VAQRLLEAPAVNALLWNRIQFGFTITFHYLFPQLTMGLALLIFVMKLLALRTKRPEWNDLARFWGRVFGLAFAVGVVTGIPMEFQFGTNWARFAGSTGGVIGFTLALEGLFAFFAESAFLGLFLFGEKRLGPRGHLFAAFMVFAGSWLSGYFIVVTNAFMQHPVGYTTNDHGSFVLTDVVAYVFNPWATWEYLHTMCAAVVTGAFAVNAVAAYWALVKLFPTHARAALRLGVTVGLVACVLQVFPTGDRSGKLVAKYQPVALAAMEGKFESSERADLAIFGQPNVAERRLENPVVVPRVLSFLAYGSFGATVRGLDDFPHDTWPDNIELLYFGYHVMAGLGTLFLALMMLAAFLLYRARLLDTRTVLWTLMLAFPFPFIATTAGWLTTELGRQPWVVYELLRTADGTSPKLEAGDVVFSTLGYMGLYFVVGVGFLGILAKTLSRGPVALAPGLAHSPTVGA
jgi:cytochrome d ubiquinol oxidase subunit I